MVWRLIFKVIRVEALIRQLSLAPCTVSEHAAEDQV